MFSLVFYLNGNISKLRGIWFWYYDMRLSYDACVWLNNRRYLHAFGGIWYLLIKLCENILLLSNYSLYH